jgi:sarcosine oxidase, subunit gamma
VDDISLGSLAPDGVTAAPARGETRIRPLPPAARYSLRLRPSPPLPVVAGLSLDLAVNGCAVRDGRLVARLGPDEWLIQAPEAEAATVEAAVAESLGERFHALVDVSHRSMALEVAGFRAAEILNAGCPLDLHPDRFPPGSATRTLLGKAEIVLLRPTPAPSFTVECWRSFGDYVGAFLAEAAHPDCLARNATSS